VKGSLNFDPRTPYYPGTYLLENTLEPDMGFGSSADAIQYLEDELLCDMLFKAPKDKLNYWALLFTPIIQKITDYHRAPFFLVHKPKRGIGATAMADAVYLINYGEWSMPQMTLTSKRDEYQVSNELLGHLERGTPMVNFDDIQGSLSHKTIVKFQTDMNPRGRALGSQRIIEVPNPYTVLCGTGKNVMVRDDMPRRTVEIVLHSELEYPSTRPLKHPGFKEHVFARRARLLSALLYCVQQWGLAGAPRSENKVGEYYDWSTAMGGLLKFLGLDILD
jgi:hypothetical protein